MEYKIVTTCDNINWETVRTVITRAGLSSLKAETYQKAFENSALPVFVYSEDALVAVGRALSDGVRQAAVYDVAVLPEYQGQGLGTLILRTMMDKLPGCQFILYANPGKEGFYEKLGFRRMKTGMARFLDMEHMRERGFIE